MNDKKILTCGDLADMGIDGCACHDPLRQSLYDADSCRCVRSDPNGYFLDGYWQGSAAYDIQGCDDWQDVTVDGQRYELCCRCASDLDAAYGRPGLDEAIREALRDVRGETKIERAVPEGLAGQLFRMLAGAMLLLAILGGPLSATEFRDTPDKTLTPGEVRTVDVREVCTTKTRTLRHDARRKKAEVLRRYGLSQADAPLLEMDHLIPLSLGGADTLANLWPEPWIGQWNASVKDKLEVRLHRMVCGGQISLVDAQAEMATDWKGAYARYFLGVAP